MVPPVLGDVHTQGDDMSRNLILIVGALLWSVAILDGLVHVATGAWPVTVAMIVAGIAGAALIAVRRRARLTVREDA